MKKILFVSLVIALCITTLLHFMGSKDSAPLSTSEATPDFDTENHSNLKTQAPSPEGGESLATNTPTLHDQLEFAHSLRGTEIDGSLSTDKDGNLILNQDVRDFFDYFLSASDELGPEAAIAELQRYIGAYLPENAASHANRLLENYLRYKRFELQSQQQPLTGERLKNNEAHSLLRKNFIALKLKRNELFSLSEDAALFELEDAYQNYTLSSLEVMANETLNDQEKSTKLNDLQRALPIELQSSQQTSSTQQRAQDQIARLSTTHHDDSDYHQALRDNGLQQEKADELVVYRQQSRQFEEQYELYAAALVKLNVDDPNYRNSVESLTKHYFDDPNAQTKARLRGLSEPKSN